ncbi:hypothetical protein RF11_10021 [Thelohanellus kitauei]|uniref:SCAN domain-containing protein 3 n=1 Tax=Thelohanellus kitauei TaxID=669202 RepID=A0A0C2MHK8_THEKT|nr:hypothetical protein RF11_10021 [Thelohanellus kitauei]
MIEEVDSSLNNYLKICQFTLRLDESKLPNYEEMLISYVRFIKHERVFLREKHSNGNILSAASDEAPTMIGSFRGCIASLKQDVPNFLAIHCVIHRQHLVSKNLNERLNTSLHYVISAINGIGSNPLQDKILSKLYSEDDKELRRLLLQTKVRWQSKGICSNLFFKLFNSIPGLH